MAETYEGIYDVLEKILECSVCLQIPKTYIVQCIIGHNICITCRNALSLCPFCKLQFTETRNFVAEELASKLNKIKVALKKNEVSTQTDFEKEKISFATQTDIKVSANFLQKASSATQTDVKASVNPIQKSTRSMHSVHTTRWSFYKCLIGTCMYQSTFKELIEHLKENHKTMFLKIENIKGIFSEKCIIDAAILPVYYDFAFLINGMGVFFVNITVNLSHTLLARVLLARNSESSVIYHYELTIKKRKYLLKHHGKVMECRMNKTLSYSCNLHTKETLMSRINTGNDKLLECTLQIHNCCCTTC
ncbi:uncharacterized protein LOC143177793 isoform X2 [Calliopsis andreniformis]|uniref:uncharacterized protein LOC143177793 isoform X2 n=1 Tax=Calliopsis andreniformis TaxID=337506 RepID=UPI003FCE5D13